MSHAFNRKQQPTKMQVYKQHPVYFLTECIQCSQQTIWVTNVNKTRFASCLFIRNFENPRCSKYFYFNFDGASFSVVEEAILTARVMLSMLFIHSLDAKLAIDQSQDVLQMSRKFRRRIWKVRLKMRINRDCSESNRNWPYWYRNRIGGVEPVFRCIEPNRYSSSNKQCRNPTCQNSRWFLLEHLRK